RYLADSAGEDEAQKGEMKNSMVYLKPEDVAKLKEQVAQFLASHAVPVEDGEPWEVTVVAYPRRQA
ncbi:MAG: hypothetical protein IJC43_03635, partial [Clostridia bacterium]|nr:hypothetical protein [Clostridia bacterium]